jgi:hypothetical protein
MDTDKLMEMLKTMLADDHKKMMASMDAKRKTDKEEIKKEMKANNKKMLAEILEKLDADSKAWRDEIRAETEAIRARTKAMREERMKANREACMADIKNDRKETTACQDAMEANLETIEPNPAGNEAAVERRETLNEEVAVHPLRACRNETMACQKKTEARLQREPASEDMTLEVAHEQEVPLDDAVAIPVGEPRKGRRDRRHLAAGHRQKQEQKRTQRKDGCRKNLVAARRAAVAWRKIIVFRKILTHGYCGLRKEVIAAGMMITRCAGHGRKRRNKDDVKRETRKGTFEKKLWTATMT